MAVSAKMSEHISAPEEILQLATDFQKSRILLSAFELGLFTALHGDGYTSDEVAAKIGANARATDRLLNALCSLGLVHKDKERFSNTAIGSRFLVKDANDYLSGLMHTVGLWREWSKLTETVKKGRKVANASIVDKDSDLIESFIAAMHQWNSKTAPGVVGRLDLTGVSRVLDVGGGSGVYAMAFVRANTDITATVFELPSVTSITRQYVSRAGLSNCIDVVGGNYHSDELGRGYDLAFLSNIICINSPEQNQALIDKVARSLNYGGRVVIHDFIMDEDRTGPPYAALFALRMLVATESGDTYTESEIRLWMKLAGFGDIHRMDSIGASAMIIGSKKPG